MSVLSVEQCESGVAQRFGLRFRTISQNEITASLTEVVDDALLAAKYGGATVDREAVKEIIMGSLTAHNDAEIGLKNSVLDAARLAVDDLKRNPAIKDQARLLGLSVDEYLKVAREEAQARVSQAVESVRSTFEEVPIQFHNHHDHDD